MKTKNIFRTLLMAAFLLAGANTVKAEDITIYSDVNGVGQYEFKYTDFANASEGDVLRVTYKIQPQIGWTPTYKVVLKDWTWNKVLAEETISDNGTIELSLTDDMFTSGDINTTDPNNRGAVLVGEWVTITSIVLSSNSTTPSTKTDVTLTYSASTTSARIGQSFTAPSLTSSVSGLTLTYSSSNTDVATIDSDGNVTLVGAGTTIITVTFAGNDDYNPASASYTLIVLAANDSLIYFDANGVNQYEFKYTDFANASGGDKLRITYNIQPQNGWTPTYKVVLKDWTWNKVLAEETISDNGTIELSLTDDMFTSGDINTTDPNNRGAVLVGEWATLTSIVLSTNNTTPSTKTDVTLTYSATTASATTASIGQTLTDAPTLTVSPEGLEGITYSSSKESVATVAADGTVTIVGAGTTTITATFAETDTHKGASASYTLTVTEAKYAITLSETTNGQISVSATEASANTTITITTTPNDGYRLSAVSVNAGDTNIEVSGTGNTRTFTMPAQDVTISATFDVIPTVEAKIESSTSFATFCSDQPLDFTGINTIEAYYAKTVENGNVYLLRIYGTVKAGTGLVLKGATTRIPVAESGDELEGNMLIGVSADTDVNASTDYVLTEKNGVAVFAQTGVNKATVAAGHAYLRVPVAQARTRAIGIGGEGTTGIDNTFIDNCEQGEMVIYNLGGQRVKNAAKGLFIINGKKKILK